MEKRSSWMVVANELNIFQIDSPCVLIIRHVQKKHFVINLLGWLTFICILVPRTIFDLNFWIKIYFQGCPEPFYYTKENAKKYKGKLHDCIFQLLRQKILYKSNLKPLAVLLRSLWFRRHPYLHIVSWHMSYVINAIWHILKMMSYVNNDRRHMTQYGFIKYHWELWDKANGFKFLL